MSARDLVASLRGCPRRWIAAALLVVVAIGALARASSLRAEQARLDAARLERLEDARKAALARLERQQDVDARRVWAERLSAAAASNSAEAIQRLRNRVSASGLAIEQLETRSATAGREVSLVDVHLAAHGGYRALRGLLADLESSPHGWSALSYDGTRLDADVLVPARAEGRAR